MCGIAGYKTTRALDPSVLSSMVDALYHRGPDSEGYHRTAGYAAGMRRLSINDVKGGSQPLFNQDLSVALLYNGEIYNAPCLRAELESKGYRFRSRSDGEVICHLYDEVGEDLFELLDGMFAVALWSEHEHKLILARDIPGEKPLYYARLSDTEVVFASEPPSLTRFPGIDLSLSLQAIWDFPTFAWIPEPDTIYHSIKVLPPSHLVVIDSKGTHLRPYKNRFNPQPIDSSDEGVVRETRRVITEAVQSRLLSDVPIGSFLSGGLDSSIVATLASREVSNLTTFTIGFEDVEDPYHGRADESMYAERYARQLGTKHHTIRVSGRDFRNDLLRFCAHGGQPFAVSSGLGILAIARAARANGIKVLLSGDCADECFGGYSWYPHLANTLNSTPVMDDDSDDCFLTTSLSLEERLKALGRLSPQKRAWAWHYFASERDKKALFHPDVACAAKSSLRHFYAYKCEPIWKPEDFIHQDRKFYLVNEMLQKVDRMTMAHSVEGRVPFAAPAVLMHCGKLAHNQMIRDTTLKWALRTAFADLLPDDIIARPKHGFNVPLDQWFRQEWRDLVEEAFSTASPLANAGLIHPGSRAFAMKLIDTKSKIVGQTILPFVSLNLWLERHKNGNHR